MAETILYTEAEHELQDGMCSNTQVGEFHITPKSFTRDKIGEFQKQGRDY